MMLPFTPQLLPIIILLQLSLILIYPSSPPHPLPRTIFLESYPIEIF